MPFDGTNFAPIAVPTKPFDFVTATPDARLLELARWLDDEQAWRDRKISWNFMTVHNKDDSSPCGTAGCALGLAYAIWPEFADSKDARDDSSTAFETAKELFDLNGEEACDLFDIGLAIARKIKMRAVTPGMVATAIRQFVAKRSAS